MRKRILTFTLFLTFVISSPVVFVFAQLQEQCSEQLSKAEDQYLLGKWSEAVDLIEQCLNNPNVSEVDKGNAYRILALVYIATQSETKATEAVRNLLTMVPNYELDPDRDPPTLNTIIDRMSQTLNPSIISILPSSSEQKGEGFTITVTGSNFVYGSVVKFNDIEKSTTFISPSELKAEIVAQDLLKDGEFNVRVYSPIQKGKYSNDKTFVVKKISEFPWTWLYVGGAAVIGAIVYFLILPPEEETSLAQPPGRP